MIQSAEFTLKKSLEFEGDPAATLLFEWNFITRNLESKRSDSRVNPERYPGVTRDTRLREAQNAALLSFSASNGISNKGRLRYYTKQTRQAVKSRTARSRFLH